MTNEAKELPPLKEALSDVFDELTKEPEEKVTPTPNDVAEESESEEVEVATDDEVEPLKADSEEDDVEPGEPEKAEEDPEPGEIKPLEHWRPEDREMFKSIPREAQEFLVDRDKRFQASVTQSQQDIADVKRAFEPIKEELAKAGVSEGEAARRLIGAHMRLKDDPAGTILELMSSYDIDIGDLTGENKDGDKTDRPDSAAKREIRELKEEFQKERDARRAADGHKLATEIEEFKANHEFFDDVREEMTDIAWSYHRKKVDLPPLADLYEKACWQNESIRKKLIAREGKSKSEKDSIEAKKAKRASRAKVRSTPKSSSEHVAETKTLREDLSATYDRLTAR